AGAHGRRMRCWPGAAPGRGMLVSPSHAASAAGPRRPYSGERRQQAIGSSRGARQAGAGGAAMARDATRRRVLTAAAAALPLVAAGCKGIAALGTPPKPAPDVTVATDAIAVETQLIAQYRDVLAASPALAPTLRPLLAQHHEHLARLRARLIVPVGGQPLPTPRATPRPTGQVPGTPAAAL